MDSENDIKVYLFARRQISHMRRSKTPHTVIDTIHPAEDTHTSHLLLDASPDAFFFSLVQDAIGHQRIKFLPETEFYLVRLLNRFISSDNLFTKNSEGQLEDQPLAFLYKVAIESEDPKQKKSLFQNLGDISLYKAGFFQESLNQTAVDLDYYIGLGETAYQNTAERCDDKHFHALFLELSTKFGHCVDVLFEVGEKTTFTKSEQDLLRLYDLWARTGSERAARALIRAGINLETKGKEDCS
jgi:hypothetical protein